MVTKKALTALLVLVCTLGIPAGASAESINPCDATVGHPSDPNRVGPGVATDQVVTHVAIPACRAALKAQPDNPRWQYQLGRALYYWAEANGGDKQEALAMIQRAADQDYVQAMFVLGLLHKYRGEPCAGRQLVKQAADQGLKSARLTYPSDVLGDVYARCGERITTNQDLLNYVTAAQQQTESYYENLLVGNLMRELSARVQP